MKQNKYDALKLENQLCFPLYVVAKEMIRKYTPHLNKVDLTYTQYITMMILWEKETCNITELGHKLYLDSGTLTPLLKKLEIKGLIKKKKSNHDSRNIIISLTEKGAALKDEALVIPKELAKYVNLTEEEVITLYKCLYKLLEGNIKS